MSEFDVGALIVGSQRIVDEEGNWPNFHDAEITDFNIWRGDVRPQDNVYIGPRIELRLTLCALREPFAVLFNFEDCESIKMIGFDNQNPIMDLTFTVEERGFLNDGQPMTPYLCVHCLPAGEFELSFKCFHAEVRKIADSGNTDLAPV